MSILSINYTDNFFLPLALRLAITFLPVLVCMRFKKPWRLALLTFFG
jgi:hypothetical protein